MEIREAQHGDARWIGDYHHRCWIEGYAGLVDQRVLDGLHVGHRISLWERTLHEDLEHPVLVAVVHDRPVGHVRVEAEMITNVYVDPNYWGQGIGRALLALGEDLLRDAGHNQGVLWTIVGNQRAIGLYESAGWVLDGQREVHPSSTGAAVDELRMIKRLTVT